MRDLGSCCWGEGGPADKALGARTSILLQTEIFYSFILPVGLLHKISFEQDLAAKES